MKGGALLDQGVVFGDHFIGGANVVWGKGGQAWGFWDDAFVGSEEVVFFTVGLVEGFSVDAGGRVALG